MNSISDSDLCKFLSWDTDFFGFRIARITQQNITGRDALAIDRWAIENQIACIYFLADYTPENIEVAAKHGYILRDVRVVLDMELPYVPPGITIPETYSLDIATSDDMPVISEMMGGMFAISRFGADPHFSDEKCDHLYQRWIQISLENTEDERVFVYRQEGIAKAFLACKLRRDERVGNMSLFGVHPQARGHDLGTGLVLAGLQYFVGEGMTQTDIVTQANNIASQRVFQKFGYRTSEIDLWYHKWYGNEG